MSNIKYISEALNLDEKKKKRHDKELPWTGLNWGEDKGKGIATFNHLNGSDFSGATGEMGGCSEEMELNEADQTRSEHQLLKGAFSGDVLKDLETAQENGGIVNIPDIQQYVKSYLKGESQQLLLRPSTRSLIRKHSNKGGAKDPEAEVKKEVVHHVLALTGDKGLEDITVTLPLQNHTRLHNGAITKLKGTISSKIKDIVDLYQKLTRKVYSKIHDENIDDEQEIKLQGLLDRILAWAYREIFLRLQQDKDYKAVYQSLLSQELGEYLVSHPELVISKVGKPITIKTPDGDYKVKIVINTIGKDQRNSLHRYVAGNVLKEFPGFLNNDFLLAKVIEGHDHIGDVINDVEEFRELFRLPEDVEESLKEADGDEEFVDIKPVEFRRYLENNLLQQDIFSEYMNGKSTNSPFYKQLSNILANLTGKKIGETELNRRLNKAGDSDKELWALKQKAVAELVRNLLDTHDFKLKYRKGQKPVFQNKLYKLNVDDTHINRYNQEYKLSEKAGALFNIEKIFEYVDGNKLIETDIKDEHFLDVNGEIVPGIKYTYRDGSIAGILIDPACDINNVYTLIVDRPVSTTSGNQNPSFKDGCYKMRQLNHLIIDEKLARIIPDSTWVNKNSPAGLFSNMTYKRVTWKNPKATTIGGGCFRSTGLEEFIIPDCVTRLGDQAFAYTDLKTIFIPKTVRYLGDNCFEGCEDCIVVFEIQKEDLPKYSSSYWSARLISGKEEYKGLTGKWGKSQVRKVVWGGTKPEPKEDEIEESLELNEDIAAVRNLFKDIPEDKFNEILKLDPTYVEGRNSVGKYTKWLLNLYKKKFLTDEDLYKVPDLLTQFEQKRRWMENKDIQQFKNLGELADALSKVEVGELSDNAKQKAEHKKLRGMDLDEINAEKVYEDEDWLVYTPKDFEASKKLSSLSNSVKGNNQWCTGISARDSGYFDSYTKDGPLYININKHDPEEESYQFHFESSQFMNKYDKRISLLKFFLNNEGLADFYLNKLGKKPDLKKALEEIKNKNTKPITVNFNPAILGAKDEITRLLIMALNNYDYETVLDLYDGLELPSVDEFRKQVSKIELNDECKQLLNKLGISEEEYREAINGNDTELSAIIEEAILTSVKRNIIDQIKAHIASKVIDSNSAISEFDWGNKKLTFDRVEVIDQLLNSYWGSEEITEENIKNKINKIIQELPSNMNHILAHGDKVWRPVLDRLNKAKYLYELANSLRYQ